MSVASISSAEFDFSVIWSIISVSRRNDEHEFDQHFVLISFAANIFHMNKLHMRISHAFIEFKNSVRQNQIEMLLISFEGLLLDRFSVYINSFN